MPKGRWKAPFFYGHHKDSLPSSGRGEEMNRLYDIVNTGLVMGTFEFAIMVILLAILSCWS